MFLFSVRCHMPQPYHFAIAIFLTTVMLFGTNAAFSKESVGFEEELEVIASHIRAENTPSITTYSIDEAQLEAWSDGTIASALRAVPGLDVQQQGGVGGLTFLSLRGGDPNFTTVLVDGVKVNDPTNSRGGAFDLGSLDPEVIESIDIYYGSLSGVYGSDALSGVINIQTKGLERVSMGRVSATADTDGSIRGTFSLSSPMGETTAFSVNGAIVDGDESHFGDAFDRFTLSARVGSLPATSNTDTYGWQANFFLADGDAEYFPEDSGGDRLAVIRTAETRDFTQKSARLAGFLKPVSKWRVDINADWSKRQETIINPGIAEGTLQGVPAITTDTAFETFTLGLTNTITAFEDVVSLAFGGNLFEEKGQSDGLIDFGFPFPASYQLDRTTHSLFAEANIALAPDLEWMSAIRYDELAEVSVTTVRTSIMYETAATGSVIFHYGEGFKMPSFFALAHPLIGNPDLLPERSKTYDISYSKQISGQLFLKMSLYKNRYADLVDFDPVLFTNVNRSVVKAKGIEIYTRWQPHEPLTVTATVSYNDAEIADDIAKLRRRPKWKAGATVAYDLSQNATLHGRVSYSGSYYDSSIPTGFVEMEESIKADMSLIWKLKQDFKLKVSLHNMFNSKAEYAIGFTPPKRRLGVQLSKNF